VQALGEAVLTDDQTMPADEFMAKTSDTVRERLLSDGYIRQAGAFFIKMDKL